MAGERATYPRATVTIDGVEYRRARFVVRDGHVRAFDAAGNLLAQTEVGVLASLDRNSTVLTGTDGSEWVATRRGCGCGGK